MRDKRIVRVLLATCVVAGFTLVDATAAFAGPAADINDGGVSSDDPNAGSPDPADEGVAVTCQDLQGQAKLATDAGAGFGFDVADLNVKGIKLLSVGECVEVQDVSPTGGGAGDPLFAGGGVGTPVASGGLTKLSGKLQTPATDCTSDTVEALGAAINPAVFGSKTTTDEYPLSGKFNVAYSGEDTFKPGKDRKSQISVRTTSAAISPLGDTLALVGVVAKGVAQGAVYSSENAFTPQAKGTIDSNANGKSDGTLLDAQERQLAGKPLKTEHNTAILLATRVDLDLDGSVTDAGGWAWNDADGDGQVGILEGGGENVVSDTCVTLNATGTPTVATGSESDGSVPVTAGDLIVDSSAAQNLPGTAGDQLEKVNFFTDGTTGAGVPLDSEFLLYFAE